MQYDDQQGDNQQSKQVVRRLTLDPSSGRLIPPAHLEPFNVKRSLMTTVQIYFYDIYNGSGENSDRFKQLLVSIGNKDALNGNRWFDRHEAVGMIKKLATKANDSMTTSAKDGDIYRCIVRILHSQNLGIKFLRNEKNRQQQQAAE